MSYTDVFGGENIFPSLLSYIEITFAEDITLQWAREQQIGGLNVVADFMDLDATAVSLNVNMPSASATGTGNKATFNNIGSNAFTVQDNDGGTIITIAPGEQWIVVLTDNTTVAGTWTTFQLGATVSVSNAGALAGAGIKAISTTLNQKIDSTIEAATPFTVVDGDRANCLIYTGGAGTCNLPSPAGVGNDWFFMLRNSGTGTLNVLPPSGNIDGGASLNLDPNDSCFIFTDGANFFTVGLSTGSTIAFDFVEITVPGSGDFVLSGANLNRISYRFTGALTGNRRIVVPNTTQQYWVDNQTTGAFTLEVSTLAGSGQIVSQGNSIILYCDGTDVINAVSQSAVSFPVTIGQGGTGATNAADARTNLDVPPNSRLINTTAPLSGGGDLSADRTLVVGIATEIATGVAEIATQAETDAGTDDARIVTPLKLTNFSGLINPNVPVTDGVAANGGFAFTNNSTFQTYFTFAVLDGERYLLEAWTFAQTTSGGQELNIAFPNGFWNGNTQALAFSGGGPNIVVTGTQVAISGFNTDHTYSNVAAGPPGSSGQLIQLLFEPTADGDIEFQARQLSADLNLSFVDAPTWARVTRVS